MNNVAKDKKQSIFKYATIAKLAAISTDFENAFNTSNLSPKKWITSLQSKVDNTLSPTNTDGSITKGLKGLGKFFINDVLLDTGSQALSAAAMPMRTTLGAYDYAKGNITGKEYTGRLADSASGALWTAATLLSGGAAKVGLKGAIKGVSKLTSSAARKAYKADKTIASQFASKYKNAEKNILQATNNNPIERTKQLQALQIQKSKEWSALSKSLQDPDSIYKYINNLGKDTSKYFLENQKNMPIDVFINTYKNIKHKDNIFRKSVWANATPEQKRAIISYYGTLKPMKYMSYSFIPTIAGMASSSAGATTLGNSLYGLGDTMYNTISYPYRSLSDYASKNMNTVKGNALDNFLSKNNISDSFKNYLFTKTKNNQYILNSDNVAALAQKLEKDSNGALNKEDATAYIRKSFAPELNTTPGAIDKPWEQVTSRLFPSAATSYKYTNMTNKLRSLYAKDLDKYYSNKL